jgi:hypothetical protein
MTARMFVERLQRARVEQGSEPQVPKVKVSMRVKSFISGLTGASPVTTA